jgi:hypothetical protein
MYKKKNTSSCQKTTKTTSGNRRHRNQRVQGTRHCRRRRVPSSNEQHPEPPISTNHCQIQPDWKKPANTTEEKHHGRERVKRKPVEDHRSSSKDISKFCTARENLRRRHTSNDHFPQSTASVASIIEKKNEKRKQQKGKKKTL